MADRGELDDRPPPGGGLLLLAHHRAPEGYALFSEKEDGCVKVVLRP